MATSIGSSAAFTSGNMKPASGEQIDALWGQNISDNTAFLRAQRLPFFTQFGTTGSSFPGTTIGTQYVGSIRLQIPILRTSGHNRIVGTLRGDGTFSNTGVPDCHGTHGFYFYGDVGTYGGTTTFATANIGALYTWGSTYAFELDMSSYLSVGSWGTIVGYFAGTMEDTGADETDFHMRFNFGVMPKIYTTWAN